MPFRITIHEELKQFNQYVKVEDISQDGLIVNGEYNMTIDQLISTLQRSEFTKEDEPEEAIESPILPGNAFKHVWIDRLEQTQHIYTFVPAQRYDIRVLDTLVEDVGFPSMIFRYDLKDKKVVRLSVVAVLAHRNSELSEQTEVFKFPFSNVDNGQVCMGPNPFPKIQSEKDLQTMHNFFISLPFSSDWFVNRNKSEIVNIQSFCESLSGKDFPMEWLKSKGMSFGEFFNY